MMIIDNKFEIGQKVFLITDPEQKPRLVTGLTITPHNITYQLSSGSENSYHYDFEMSEEANVLITSNN